MKRENTLKKYLVGKMGTRWDVQSHEDRYSDAVPDLSYAIRSMADNISADGWIELKQKPKWPVKPETPVKFSRYTAGQVNWMTTRGKTGVGKCWVLCKIEDEYLLFKWIYAKELRNGMTRLRMYHTCACRWANHIDAELFASHMLIG